MSRLKSFENLFIVLTFILIKISTFQFVSLWDLTNIASDYMIDFLQFKIKPILNITLASLQIYFLLVIRYQIKKYWESGDVHKLSSEVEIGHKRVNLRYTSYYGMMCELSMQKHIYGRNSPYPNGHWENVWEEEEDEGWPTMLGITLSEKLPKLFAVKWKIRKSFEENLRRLKRRYYTVTLILFTLPMYVIFSNSSYILGVISSEYKSLWMDKYSASVLLALEYFFALYAYNTIYGGIKSKNRKHSYVYG